MKRPTSVVVAVSVAAWFLPVVFLQGCGGAGEDTSTTEYVPVVSTTGHRTTSDDSDQTKVTTTASGHTSTTSTTTIAEPLGMKEVGCSGPELDVVVASSAHKCQQHCEDRDGCKAWRLTEGSEKCTLLAYCDYMVRASPGHRTGIINRKPRSLKCNSPNENVDCPGNDIEHHVGMSFGQCCSQCAATRGCLMFSLTNGVCYLKSRCPRKVYTGATRSGWMQRPGTASHQDYYSRISRHSFKVHGYQCGDGYPATVMMYPEGDGPFGLVVFQPGAGGDIDRMDDWLETVAGLGMVVMAPFHGGGGCRGPSGTGHGWNDVLTLLNTTYSNRKTLHPVLNKIDWRRVGLMGHSLGAKSVIDAAHRTRQHTKFPIRHHVHVVAVVASHDAGNADRMPGDVAAMFTTGSEDHRSDVEGQFWISNASLKVFANLQGAHHMEPVPNSKLGWGSGVARENWWSAQFLSCHVGLNQDHCSRVYGTGPHDMRNVNEYTKFVVQGPHAADSSTQIIQV